MIGKTGSVACKYGDCTPSPSRQPHAREFGGQGGDSSKKLKASHFAGIYSAFERPGTSMFAYILATKAQLSLWVGFKSTKERTKSHNGSAGAGAQRWRGLSPLLSRESSRQPRVAGHAGTRRLTLLVPLHLSALLLFTAGRMTCTGSFQKASRCWHRWWGNTAIRKLQDINKIHMPQMVKLGGWGFPLIFLFIDWIARQT